MKINQYWETLEGRVYFKNLFRQDKERFLQALRDDFGTRDLFLTRSGRMSILLSLQAFGLSREDEVMVPRFMCTSVLDALNRAAKPYSQLTQRTKAVLFYHQWGFQQNYAKAESILRTRKLWIIENCAHGLWGRSQGKLVGTFGHTAIFSLAKIFEITYAGALRVNEHSLISRIEEMLSQKATFVDLWDSIQGEWKYVSLHKTSMQRREGLDVQVRMAKWYATLLMYPHLSTLRGKLPGSQQEVHAVFTRQNKHFLYLLNNSRDHQFMLPGDEEAAMAPICFPVISEDQEFLNRISQWFKERSIIVPILHFDINRCMFEPDYKKCVPVPLYASLPERLYTDFVREFKGRF